MHRRRLHFWRICTLLAVACLQHQDKSANNSSAPPTPGEPSQIDIDAPVRVTAGKPFSMRVFYSVAADKHGQPADKRNMHVVTDRSADVVYCPTDLDLPPNCGSDIDVTVNPTRSGLAELLVASDHYHNVQLSVDVGFHGQAQWAAKEPLEGGRSNYEWISFVDELGNPLSLDAPLLIRIFVANGAVRQFGAEQWSNQIDIIVPKGARDTGALEVRPTLLVGSPGTLALRAFLNDDKQMLFGQSFKFDIVPPVWLRLVVAIAGSLAYSVYVASRAHAADRTVGATKAVVAALLAGVLAWAFADLSILGIRVDTTHLTGYFIAGLLTSYAGIEPLLARFVAKHNRQDDGNVRDTRMSAQPPGQV